MDEGYRKALRKLMERKGLPVKFEERERERFPDSPHMWVCVYGWVDYDAREHGRNCGWEVPAGVILAEVTYSEFTDTEAPNVDSIGINVESSGDSQIRCMCGRFSGMTLRWKGSLADALQELFGPPSSHGPIIL